MLQELEHGNKRQPPRGQAGLAPSGVEAAEVLVLVERVEVVAQTRDHRALGEGRPGDANGLGRDLADRFRMQAHGSPLCRMADRIRRRYQTYLKVHGRWCYLYRAIDRNGNLVDVLFSEHRDMAAAQAFFLSAQVVTGVTPDRVTTDGHDSDPRAIRTELGKGVRHRTSAYLNNRLEQDHRGIKARYRPMRGFKCPRSAARFCRRASSPACSCPGADHAASGGQIEQIQAKASVTGSVRAPTPSGTPARSPAR